MIDMRCAHGGYMCSRIWSIVRHRSNVGSSYRLEMHLSSSSSYIYMLQLYCKRGLTVGCFNKVDVDKHSVTGEDILCFNMEVSVHERPVNIAIAMDFSCF